MFYVILGSFTIDFNGIYFLVANFLVYFYRFKAIKFLSVSQYVILGVA